MKMSENINQLVDKYNIFMNENNFCEALGVTQKLIALEPKEKDHYVKKIHALKNMARFYESLDTALEGLKFIPHNPLLAHVAIAANENLKRARNHTNILMERLKNKRASNNKCDIICMASNEGPYIADFIHYYLQRSASNIYIGINNTSKDETLEILEKISREHPNVHTVDTNAIDAKYVNYSNASFELLWRAAALTSDSSFAFVVDVDEFLVFEGIDFSLSDLIDAYLPFDCLSFSYIEQHGSKKAFTNPFMAVMPSLKKSPWTKCIISYDAPIIEISPHVPVFDINEFGVSCKFAAGAERKSKLLFGNHLFYRHYLDHKEISSVDYSKHPWIYHIKSRSELEYSFRCINSWPGAQTFFYRNRGGYFRIDSAHEDRDLVNSLSDYTTFQGYIDELDNFKKKCGINYLIEKSIMRYSEETLIDRLQNIDIQVILDEKKIWRKSFSGTKYLKLLENRLDENSC